MRIPTIAAAVALLAGASALAESRPVVVELFTSQGCSSCPPADMLLGELARRPDVIALAYHVDYWDRLGWKDPFGLAEATARQKAYARTLALRTIYTPQMVIDGKADVIGSDRQAVAAAMGGGRDGVPVTLTRASGALAIDIAAGVGRGPAEVVAVAYSPEAETRVARGENAGRTLKEYAIVRAVRPLGRWDGTAARFNLDLSALPPTATMVAVLIQDAGQGPVLGAATASLR